MHLFQVFIREVQGYRSIRGRQRELGVWRPVLLDRRLVKCDDARNARNRIDASIEITLTLTL